MKKSSTRQHHKMFDKKTTVYKRRKKGTWGGVHVYEHGRLALVRLLDLASPPQGWWATSLISSSPPHHHHHHHHRDHQDHHQDHYHHHSHGKITLGQIANFGINISSRRWPGAKGYPTNWSLFNNFLPPLGDLGIGLV